MKRCQGISPAVECLTYDRPMRRHQGQEVCTIGEVATLVGVSQQTLRVWEAKNLLSTVRSPGGQRLYGPDALARAQQIVKLRRSTGWNSAAISTALAARPDGAGASGLPRHGDNLRRARRARNFTLKELSAQVGVSSGTLSSYERGEALISSAITARLADALLVPLSLLGSSTIPREAVFRHGSLPTTVIEGNVVWEELGSQGHDMEPAILTVPPSQNSGGIYSRPGEIFVYVLKGTLTFTFTNTERRVFVVEPNDAITVPARTVFEWGNVGSKAVRALWIESLAVSGITP
jgi:DNA-binding transcriptional MerR regulator/mannose-6-phosphate isomerase-like protein (cupin superfamily)